jgi:hypothetical protein
MDEQPEESPMQLLARHAMVADLVDEARKSLKRCKKPTVRLRKAQWAGSLYFILLQIERELSERGIPFHSRDI